MAVLTQYPQAQISITMDDASVLNLVRSLLRQLKGVRSVRVHTTPKTQMTEEEFYAKIDQSLSNTENNPTYTMLPNESGEAFLNRMLQAAKDHV